MEKFLVRTQNPKRPLPVTGETGSTASNQPHGKHARVDIDSDDIPRDPGLRRRISEYNPIDQDRVWRAYLQKGPCQPVNHKFSQTIINGWLRRFNPSWFVMYRPWLEYSIDKDAAYYLNCYLFKPQNEEGGGDAFTSEGFRNWKKCEKLGSHVGGPTSAHNKAREKADDLLNQKQSIQTSLSRQTDRSRTEYQTRLNTSVETIRFLLRQGLTFRGHDESLNSRNQVNFLEFLKVLSNNFDNIKNVVLKNAPDNHKLTSPVIQKHILRACTIEISNSIASELGDACFAILIDGSRDMSYKEQMAIVLRYVDTGGRVVERFFEVVHVADTNAITLKEIEAMLAKHGLSLSRLRGQGYDGATNMRGEFNGLKTLILKENESAFYIHCFAHQLQLALVAVARKHRKIDSLFHTISNISNVVGVSAKRRDILQEKHAVRILEALETSEIKNGKGLNQELVLRRSGDTRWSSHYNALVNLVLMYASVIEVTQTIQESAYAEKRAEATAILIQMRCFEFVFCLHLMRAVLELIFELSQALQKKEQDIVNEIELVRIAKQRFQEMRTNEWDSFLDEVSSFCIKLEIDIPKMDDRFVPQGRSRRNSQDITNLHHYRIELFYTVIDMQLQELNNRFNEVNTELLLCASCFNPRDCFSTFEINKLVCLADLYPNDFSASEPVMLRNQLATYIIDMRSNIEFSSAKGITELVQKMVEKRNDCNCQCGKGILSIDCK